jgi:hypothetical protein
MGEHRDHSVGVHPALLGGHLVRLVIDGLLGEALEGVHHVRDVKHGCEELGRGAHVDRVVDHVSTRHALALLEDLREVHRRDGELGAHVVRHGTLATCVSTVHAPPQVVCEVVGRIDLLGRYVDYASTKKGLGIYVD